MPLDYEGSIAQKYQIFQTTQVITAVAGDNYKEVAIFIGTDNTTANFVDTPPTVNTYVTVTKADYASVVKNDLLSWLDGFFASNAISNVHIIVFAAGDPSDFGTAGLETAYDLWKYLAYFKLILQLDALEVDAQLALADLCQDDPASQCMINTDDAECLDPDSTISIAYALNQAGSTGASLVYYADSNTGEPINSALVQLGLTLALLNSTGTPVGNKLDYMATLNIESSGTDGGNLSSTDSNDLIDQNIGYWLTVGDGTGQVAQYGGLNLAGVPLGAFWVQNYLDYVMSIQASEYLTDPTANRYKNNETYQGILLIVQVNGQPFNDLGVLSGFKITAPSFINLPATDGNKFIIPNAWQATFNQNIKKVTVTGTLFITV